MLFANGPAILTGNFPPAQRGQALGLQATMTYLGLTAGPALGGLLAAHLGWRSVFYINVPVGALALALSARFIPRDRPAERGGRFDIAGACTFLLSLVALLLALNQGHEWGWTAAPVLGLLAAAVAFGGAFLAVEKRVASPMLDLSLFASRVFSASTASAVLNYVCLYGITFLMPFYLIQGRGLGPAQAGLILTAQPLVMAVAAPLAGTLSDRIGSRLLSTAGMVLLGIGLLLLSRLGPESPFGQVVGSLAVVGLGIGIFISPNTSALMGAAPRSRQGIAAGVLATARNVGMVLGVGLAGAIFTTVLARGPAGETASLFAAVRLSFLVAAGVAFLGAVVAAARGG
jgi:EmrB/QacA subfamily drug resistance transporter